MGEKRVGNDKSNKGAVSRIPTTTKERNHGMERLSDPERVGPAVPVTVWLIRGPVLVLERAGVELLHLLGVLGKAGELETQPRGVAGPRHPGRAALNEGLAIE